MFFALTVLPPSPSPSLPPSPSSSHLLLLLPPLLSVVETEQNLSAESVPAFRAYPYGEDKAAFKDFEVCSLCEREEVEGG